MRSVVLLQKFEGGLFMKEIKLATIGSGSIVHSFLDGVKATEGICLEAVYSRSEEKGRKLASEYGVGKVYTDLAEMLADPEVNFVYVASPNSLHYPQTKAALLAGKHVICEKPFCTKAAQARELAALAKEKGLFLVDAVPTAFLPNFEILKEQLPKVGKLRLVICNYTQYSSRYDQLLAGKITNVFDPNFAGGCLQDINFYNVYLNIALFGKPEAVRYYPNMASTGVDTSGVLMMQYPGFVSTNAGSKDAYGVNMVQIEGEQGYIYVKDGSNGIAEVRVGTKDSNETFNAQPCPSRWFYEVHNLVPILLSDDYEAIYKRLDTMISVIETIETARTEAGILFPGD